MSEPKDTKITPFLMFSGEANEAIKYYLGIFADAKIVNIENYGQDDDGPEGTVKVGVFSVHGQEIMCTDAATKPDFTFTPSISLFVTTTDEAEIDRYFEALAKGGKEMMPLGDYGFSRKFGWVEDKFGISWQINLVQMTG